MTSVVSQLEDLGFAERLPDPADGRVARVAITRAGRRPDRRTQDTAEMRSQDYPGRVAGGTAPVIVVGMDGSPASWDAFSWATGEAARDNGRLIAVYATRVVGPFGEPSDYAAAEPATVVAP
jgi:universal stress protein family protein